jgi:hypothetical protein
MRRRVAKEFRALLLTWSVTTVAGLLVPWGVSLRRTAEQNPAMNTHATDVLVFILGLTPVVLYGGVVLLVAMSFGVEFQQRTLPLLLAQPVTRARIWNEKLLVVAAAIITSGLLQALGWVAAYFGSGGEVTPRGCWPDLFGTSSAMVVGCALLLPTICSTGFWTLVARSTIGGAAFSATSQFLTALGASFLVSKAYGEDAQFGPRLAWALALGGLIYSGLFLYLGWQTFAGFQLRHAEVGEGSDLLGATGRARGWLRWMVCGPRQNLLNLFRKELRLQTPVALVAAVFSACWLVTLVLHWLWPQQGYNHLLVVLLCFYVPLSLILAGCVSLGEEKSLGLAAWQLTLPTSARRLWVVKLCVAMASGLTLGVLLPCFLGLLYLATDPSVQNWSGPGPEESIAMLLMGLLALALSFWAITLMSNTIRAALATILGLALAAGCVALGVWGATGVGPLQSDLLVGLMTRFQLSPLFIANSTWPVLWLALLAAGALFLAVLLAQSFVQFRRARQDREALVKYPFVLGLIILLSAFWACDFASSAQGLYQSQPQAELETALRTLVSRRPAVLVEEPFSASAAEVERVGNLSENTKRWIANSTFTIRAPPTSPPGQLSPAHFGAVYSVTLNFPKGTPYFFGFMGPRR